MGTFTRLAAEIWRAFVTDGVEASGVWKPKKAEIVVWGTELENLAGDFYSSISEMATSDVVTDDKHKSLIIMPDDGSSITATLDDLGALRTGFAVAIYNPKTSTRFHKITTDSETIKIPPWHTAIVFRNAGGLMVDAAPPRYRVQGLQMFLDSSAPNDDSDGLSNSEPKKTIKSAAQSIYNDFDCQNAEPALDCVGASNESVALQGQLTGFNYLRIKAATLGAFVWGAGASGFCLLVGDNAEALLQNLKFTRGAQASATLAAGHQPGVLDIDNCEFGDAGVAGTHASMDHGGASMNFGVYKVSGPAATHLQVGAACSGTQAGNVTIVITGTPAIIVWFSISGSGANHAMGSGVTYSGPIASGCTKYLVSINGSLSLSGSTPPGSIAGSATAGGQVIA